MLRRRKKAKSLGSMRSFAGVVKEVRVSRTKGPAILSRLPPGADKREYETVRVLVDMVSESGDRYWWYTTRVHVHLGSCPGTVWFDALHPGEDLQPRVRVGDKITVRGRVKADTKKGLQLHYVRRVGSKNTAAEAIKTITTATALITQLQTDIKKLTARIAELETDVGATDAS